MTHQSAQEWTHRTLVAHQQVDCIIEVLNYRLFEVQPLPPLWSGSRGTITDITEYIYFSLLQTALK